jgi:CBS domain-containing protein
MLLRDVMTRGVECIGPDETVLAAARKMRDLDVGSVPVCDRDRLAGMVTDRDLAVRAVAEGANPVTCRVRDVMTPGVAYRFDDDPVDEAERVMKQKQIRRLLVLNRDRRLVGIVSLGDLAVRGDTRREVGDVLHDVSEPAVPVR